ncbi:MAG: VapC toxin family PIN domain ribonuclease [Betaproteobacteria bacterium]|nr:VapC toxin family PIN domain ribonuclease [Betaproteobacteria bacterium]MCL2886281.1 VapC toxin family PIN domain ribonuclease [Betaproteobacteria bacterium]
MRGVLVDTSIWVDHFRLRNEVLVNLLLHDLVMAHPLIIGEIACGTPPDRTQTLLDLDQLQPTQIISIREVLHFIGRERLYGLGCGLVDIMLLASALMTPGVELWTLDKRLSALAERFGIKHQPVLH